MATITAVINTLNEAKNIRYCLQSLSWCDEIVVVDMYSEDETVKIASEFTQKIFMFEKMGYVEPARKFAVDQASGDWVLIVDADELIPVCLKNKFLEIIKQDEADVVNIPRKNYIMGEWVQHTGWWPDYQSRLFRKGMISFTDQIHGCYKINEKAKTIFLPATKENGIVHFNFVNSEHFITKLNSYTTVEAKHLFDDNHRFCIYNIISTTLREIYNRYFKSKGFKDGYLGLYLSLIMGFYKILTYIKLWELYKNKNTPVEIKYDKIKVSILNEYNNNI